MHHFVVIPIFDDILKKERIHSVMLLCKHLTTKSKCVINLFPNFNFVNDKV